MKNEYLSKFLRVQIKDYFELKNQSNLDIRNDIGVIVDKRNVRSLFDKFLFLFCRKRFIKSQLRNLNLLGIDVNRVLAVYPSPERPLVVFDIESNAEKYVLDNIIPYERNTIKGALKKALSIVNQFNISINCFILIAGKKNEFESVSNFRFICDDSDKKYACISTSNPVFISFDVDSDPKYVIHRANEAEYIAKKELYSSLGKLMAKPIDYIEKGDISYIVEEALIGKPWFKLKENNEFTDNAIRFRARATLRNFQGLVRQNKKWKTTINIAEKLTLQLQVTNQLRKFSSPLISKLQLVVGHLSHDAIVPSHFQHGDFCINNIIWGDDDSFVIDFEDFGKVAIPLFDEFSLAVSLNQQKSHPSIDSLSQDILFCLEGTDKCYTKYYSELFLYFLLFRLGDWGTNPLREPFCKQLIKILEIQLNNPELLIQSN